MVEVEFEKGIMNWQEEEEEGGEGVNGEEGIELSLGLSLNGKFGVDPTTKNHQQLKRSYSTMTAVTRVDPVVSSTSWTPLGTLTRTYSLPVEVEEESRRIKEMQMIRRREAKRRRSEKQRIYAYAAAEVDDDGGDEDEEKILPLMLSRGSSTSSGLSEFDTQTLAQSQRTNRSLEAKSPQNLRPFSELTEDRSYIQNPKATESRSVSGTKGMVKNVLEDMPCVTTIGDGPNGKRVDGFLYRYKKGEEVRIVCVCHGSFFTPAEFVKHAGGDNVENPLRHIVVSSSPFL